MTMMWPILLCWMPCCNFISANAQQSLDYRGHILSALANMSVPASIPQWMNEGGPHFTRVSLQQHHGLSINTSGSRSQFFEETRAIHKYFKGYMGGTFLELGALDGQLYSNTLVLDKQMHWRGVLIEGSPRSFAALKKNRPDQITMNAVICNNESTVHYLEGASACCRGVVEFMGKEKQDRLLAHKKGKLKATPCVPLRSLFSSIGINHVNLFFLDVEGAELSVLQTIDFDSVSFDVLCVEGGKDREAFYIEYLQPRGYRLVNETVKKRKNTWFLRNDFVPSGVNK